MLLCFRYLLYWKLIILYFQKSFKYTIIWFVFSNKNSFSVWIIIFITIFPDNVESIVSRNLFSSLFFQYFSICFQYVVSVVIFNRHVSSMCVQYFSLTSMFASMMVLPVVCASMSSISWWYAVSANSTYVGRWHACVCINSTCDTILDPTGKQPICGASILFHLGWFFVCGAVTAAVYSGMFSVSGGFLTKPLVLRAINITRFVRKAPRTP